MTMSTVTDITVQKQLVYNKLLPYSDLLADESSQRLSIIKGYLGISIQLRDFDIGTVHWVAQLSRYIKLFGYNFTKNDHITFVKTLFELVTLPDMDYGLVQKFAQCLIVILKKKELLTREDISIAWRPLYLLYKNAIDSPLEEYGLVFLPLKIEETLRNLINTCRPYFAPSATKEMLDEWRPLICPTDVTMSKAITYLELFLPTLLPPELFDQEYRLWFDELMQLWCKCGVNSSWDSLLVNLFTRLATDHLGYIDWQPHIVHIFTRILACFGLPIGASKNAAFQPNYDIGTIASWIVSMLGPGSGAQDSLNKLLGVLKSYYHPSNAGPWTPKLLQFLSNLSRNVVDRVFRERYKPPSWLTPVPQTYHLSNADVTVFVESMLPIVLVAMFSKGLRHDVAVAFQHLSSLRPEIIIPPLLEQTYPALETLTEPHRLTACLMCANTVVRSMVSSTQWFPQGRMHVIPLLNLCLPGIDPNDSKKTLITLQLISNLCSLVPIINSSEAIFSRTDLTEDEKELCSSTSQFEDFVLVFLDRAISLVENSSHEHTRTEIPNALQLDQEEKIVGLALLTVASTVFQQCSAAIYDEALKKLCSFVIGSVFEIHVGGIYVAVLVQAAVKARPEKALKVFVPHFMSIVRARDRHEIASEEHLDAEFVWSVKMLAELAGSECDLLCYLPDFTYVLELTLHVKSKRVRELAGLMLRQLLKYMTTTYPVEYKSSTVDFDDPQTDVLPIREWGKPGDLHNLDISWHVASAAERQAAIQVLRTFLLPELESLRQHVANNSLSREELLQSLMIINHCVVGASFLLPPLQGDEVKLVDSPVELRRFDVVVKDANTDISLDGQNVRMMVLQAIRPLLSHILATSADDTKSLTVLIRLYASLLYVNGITKLEYNSRCNSRALSKRSLENRLMPKKRHMRILLIDRIALQHEMRIVYRTHERFTTIHRDILKDLFRLSVSDYGLVRQIAQTNLWLVFRSFAYAYKVLTEDILECLRSDSGISKERFKGALHLIQGNSQHSLLTKKHWDFVCRLWPALVRAQHSEDLSVMKVFDELAQRLKQEYQTLSLGSGAGLEDTNYRQLLSSAQQLNNIDTDISMAYTDGIDFVEVESPDDANTQHIEDEEQRSSKQISLNSALAVVEHLWDEGSTAKPIVAKATGKELESAAERELSRNKEHLRLYYGLIDDLVLYLENTGTVRWKFYQLALDMLSFLVRHDVRLPARAVRLLVKGLVSDSLLTRQSCLLALTSVLKQHKRRHVKVEVNPYEMGGGSGGREAAVPVPGEDIVRVMQPGDRPDNRWLLYDSRTLPTTKDAWEKCVFVEKTHWGYYTWPKPMQVYASIDKQPKIGRLPEELRDDELAFYEMFTDTAFVDKFMRFLSIEEHRAHDKFQMRNFMFFKGLFRNFDDAFVAQMRPHIEKLMEDREPGTRETSQRCVAEIVAALIRSSKHWDFDRVQNLWAWLLPVLRSALVNITTETQQDWTIFFYLALDSRDPRKMAPLLELLMDNPIRGEGGSFGDCSRLTMLQTALGQQEWRVSELQHRLLAYIQPNITHPYKNVRDRVGSMLMNIFLTDSVFPGAISHTPHLSTFINAMLPQLNSALSKRSLTSLPDSIVQQGSVAEPMDVDAGTSSSTCSARDNAKAVDSSIETETGTDEHKAFVRTCKTLLKLMQDYLFRSVSGLAPEMLGFLPIICQLERDSDDEDLRTECSTTLAVVGLAPLSDACVPVMLDTIRQILSLELWHARETVLKLLQVVVVSNLFILQPHSKVIESMVIERLRDPHVEVRTMASITLSGLFQCGFLSVTDEIIKQFVRMARTQLSKQKAVPGDKDREQKLVTRHAGVLGLCACVLAYPYDVPDFMPALLVKLSEHINDSQLIQATVKKSLSNFKRTHHDSWHNHKQKFTDDQLAALTELLVSPNYYA